MAVDMYIKMEGIKGESTDAKLADQIDVRTQKGGLVDGPVYRSIYQNLKGIALHEPDEYEAWNTGAIVYPRISGELVISGQQATGSLVAVTPLRVRLGARTSATTIPSRITASATPQTVVTETAGRITLDGLDLAGLASQDAIAVALTVNGSDPELLVDEPPPSQSWKCVFETARKIRNRAHAVAIYLNRNRMGRI